jgi:hypothetical protein
VRASIHAADGVLLATGYGTSPMAGKGSYAGRGLEKAETAAIGRALAHAGFGTLYALDDDDDADHLADSPIEPPRQRPVPSVERDAPASGWTPAQFEDLKKLATEVGVPIESLPGLLGVKRISEYTPGYQSAVEMVKAHGAALKANGAK